MVVRPHPSGETAQVGYDAAWRRATSDQVTVASTLIGAQPGPGQTLIEASAVGPLYADLPAVGDFVAGVRS